MNIARIAACTAAAVTVSLLAAPASYAGDKGKAGGGCSNPYVLAYWDTTGQLYFGSNDQPEPRIAAGIALGLAEGIDLVGLLDSVDHNGNGYVCIKTPSGWPADNTGPKAYFVNVVDDKVTS
jgi:hypothetical protein